MRVLSGSLLAFALVGCNAILGIDAASLDTSDGGAGNGGASGGSGGAATGGGGGSGTGGAGGGACSLGAPDPCNTCVAANCCDKYDACVADSDCRTGLSQYNVCVGVAFTNDAGGTCDETFATSANLLRSNLATCAFLRGSTSTPPGCSESCKGKPVGGDICATYCVCVSDACPTSRSKGATASRSAERSPSPSSRAAYHRGLAANAKASGDEPLRQTHCGHTFGEALPLA
jgi:hypothetical protein